MVVLFVATMSFSFRNYLEEDKVKTLDFWVKDCFWGHWFKFKLTVLCTPNYHNQRIWEPILLGYWQHFAFILAQHANNFMLAAEKCMHEGMGMFLRLWLWYRLMNDGEYSLISSLMSFLFACLFVLVLYFVPSCLSSHFHLCIYTYSFRIMFMHVDTTTKYKIWQSQTQFAGGKSSSQ